MRLSHILCVTIAVSFVTTEAISTTMNSTENKIQSAGTFSQRQLRTYKTFDDSDDDDIILTYEDDVEERGLMSRLRERMASVLREEAQTGTTPFRCT
ncbi:hypothetical protein PsorP6_015731 [Peronosclerospora sorghi]|uniref:Uncharacterized protein n=1 Tax=Peronosclerospora sorghi TaxID=230839 RepID=A0ACC0WNM1_9STRA|nr:hypothetical protein PsorP6_015731 [Peronosclerospora sorghi]